MKKLILLSLIAVGMISCTDNARAKRWGGKATVNLPKHTEFVNATWKGDGSLWVIVKDTITNEIYMFEDSPFGIMEGRVVFKYGK